MTRTVNVVWFTLAVTGLFASSVFAQRFETSPFVEIQGGMGFPVNISNSHYSNGPVVVGSIGTPLAGTILASFQIGGLFPSVDLPNTSFTVTMLSLDLAIPFAPEAASTVYLFAGLSEVRATISTPLIAVSSDWKLGFNTGLGYLIAPESWRSIYLDFQIRYNDVFTTNGWQDVSILGGIGFHLF